VTGSEDDAEIAGLRLSKRVAQIVAAIRIAADADRHQIDIRAREDSSGCGVCRLAERFDALAIQHRHLNPVPRQVSCWSPSNEAPIFNQYEFSAMQRVLGQGASLDAQWVRGADVMTATADL